MAKAAKAWGRMCAWYLSEVPATVLEAYRRASLPVFEVMDVAEARRLECAADGLDPWTVPPATRAEFLCAWNAFVLQTLGNDILDADYDASPATVGYLPNLTALQVLAFYAQVEEWLTRARQAHANPDFRLDVDVPARLPAWKDTRLERMPATMVAGVLRAMRSVGEHAAAAMSFLPRNAPEPGQQAQLNRIRHVYASAESKARYALELHGAADAEPEVHRRLEPLAREAIELFYQLGQLIADPSLVADAAPPLSAAPRPAPLAAPPAAGPPPKAATRTPAGPGASEEAAFDMWCLTDPDARTRLQHNKRAVRALRKMWKLDPDPARTVAIQAEIQSALDRGLIAYASDGTERLGYFHCCPWGAIYVASRPVTLGGTRLQPMDRFVYDVGDPSGDAPFQRRILSGSFPDTAKLQYGPDRHEAEPRPPAPK